MLLQSLSLTNFRNYSKAEFSFSPTTTLVVGPNTSGKTNLLEAIYYLASGKSFRGGYDREVIRSGEVFARIKGIKGVKGVNEGNDGGLELAILANENGENTSSKRFKINGVKKRLFDFAGNLRAVYFGPEEIQLVTGSPSRRRKYLDSVLCQVDREYARTLLEYEKVLRQRNRLLSLLRERGGRGERGELEIWDEKLAVLGPILSKERQEMLADFNVWLKGNSRLVLLFRPRPWSSESTLREREIAAGMTLRGPHRDDFRFMKGGSENSENSVNQRIRASESQSVGNSDVSDALTYRGTEAPSYSEFSDLSSYGSRGEQRLAVLHLKLAELEFITKRAGERPASAKAPAGRPVLLLDDIFSELDEDNRGRVLELFGKQQTIVTATDLDQIDGEKLGKCKMLRLQSVQKLSF